MSGADKAPHLKVNKLTKSFDGKAVLNSVSFEIPAVSVEDAVARAGERRGFVLGIAGGSGSGKSTLLRLIQGLEAPDSGTIECGLKTGFMFQDFQLFPHMTVWQNVVYAPKLLKACDGPQLASQIDNKAKAMLDKIGIGDKVDGYPGNLSGGQKQRVALARALMMNPEVLLCDEPTSGLDVATISEVVSLLRGVRDLGMVMLIASHDLDFLYDISDRVVAFKNGEIVEDLCTPDVGDGGSREVKMDFIECIKKFY